MKAIIVGIPGKLGFFYAFGGRIPSGIPRNPLSPGTSKDGWTCLSDTDVAHGDHSAAHGAMLADRHGISNLFFCLGIP